MDREAWRAVIHGVAKSQTRLSDWTELNLPVPSKHFCWQLISRQVSPGNTKYKYEIHIQKWAFILVNYIEPTNTQRVKQFPLKYTEVLIWIVMENWKGEIFIWFTTKNISINLRPVYMAYLTWLNSFKSLGIFHNMIWLYISWTYYYKILWKSKYFW